MSVDKLKSDGIIIRDETKEGANTAQRVGSWMVDAAEAIENNNLLENVPKIVEDPLFIEKIIDADNKVVSAVDEEEGLLHLFKQYIPILTKGNDLNVFTDILKNKLLSISDKGLEIPNKYLIEVGKGDSLLCVKDINNTEIFSLKKEDIHSFTSLKQGKDAINLGIVKDLFNNLILSYTSKGLEIPNKYLIDYCNDDLNLLRITDLLGNLILAISKDGTTKPTKLELPKATIEEIKAMIKNSVDGKVTTDFSQENILQIPFPQSLGRVDIRGNLMGISKDNAVICSLEYNNFAGVYFKKFVELSWQGSSSIVYPKKNYSNDLLNEDGSSFKLKIGDWLHFDSFHLKANYIDTSHALNVVCARIYEAMQQTRIFGEQRPWQSMQNETYGAPNGNLSERIDTGALGHIDGFPIEVYINDEYHGLYTWNIKKSRPNYMMEKNNPKHIQFELGSHTSIGSPEVPWDTMEIRNPKGIPESEEPEEGEVKDAIVRLWDWARNFTNDSFLLEYKDYINLPFWVDWILFLDLIKGVDCTKKNTLWCTWNQLVWSPLPYDLDTTLGMHFAGTGIDYPPDTKLDFDQPIVTKILKNFKNEVDARYKELRDLKVFDLGTIIKSFADFENIIGEEAYKRDQERWTQIPSNRPDGTYSLPPTQGGFYASLGQKRDWMRIRLEFLDKEYNYQTN